MATDALLDGYEETLWIDSDVDFHPDSIDRLRSHQLPITCGIYPQKGKLALASNILPGSAKIVFGKEGGLTEILYAGAGFLLVRREVYLTIQKQLKLPMCNERFKIPLIPFFHPMLNPCEDGTWYLAEDYAFCERARQCGYKIMADTTIRLWHIGSYAYGWEDAGRDRERFDTFTLNLGPPPPEATSGDGTNLAEVGVFGGHNTSCDNLRGFGDCRRDARAEPCIVVGRGDRVGSRDWDWGLPVVGPTAP
jgi:hypothetical protein